SVASTYSLHSLKPRNGLLALNPVLPMTLVERDSSKVRSSSGTGKACAMVQPPVASQVVPLTPPVRYSGNVAPVDRFSEGRYVWFPSAVESNGMTTPKPPSKGAGSRRVKVLDEATWKLA